MTNKVTSLNEATQTLIANQPPANVWDDDLLLVRLAREIATDHLELEQILQRYRITSVQWERIKNDAYFNSVLTEAILAWNSVNNTHERTKLKAAAVIEEWIPEAYHALHARGETLTARVGLATLLSKIAGMGVMADGVNVNGGAEKFVININLGAQKEVRIEKVINAELGAIEEIERGEELTPMQIRALSGGGVKQADPFGGVLNPVELVKKW